MPTTGNAFIFVRFYFVCFNSDLKVQAVFFPFRADVATAKQPARATSGGGHRNSAAVAPSPNKRTQRRDEGWKEVTTRKFTNSNRFVRAILLLAGV